MIKQANLSHEDMELLSAYLDGALQVKEVARFEFRLQESADLRQALEVHRQLQWNLRHLPRPKLPHNFILTRAEAQAVKRQKAWIPIFSTASLVSFLLMAVLFVLPLFSPAASPAPQNLAMEPSLSAPVTPATAESLKAQVVPEASPLPETTPTEMVPAPMAATSNSSAESVYIFFYSSQVMGKGGGGGGDASLASGGGGGDASLASGGGGGDASLAIGGSGGGGLDAYLYPAAQPAGNPGTFGNAPYGIVVPVEPIYGKNPGLPQALNYDLEQALAATPSLPPLILGMDLKNGGQIISTEPALSTFTEPTATASTQEATQSLSAPAEVPLRSPEPGLGAETPTGNQAQTRAAQSSNLVNIFKIAAGTLALLFAGLALSFKKR